MFQWYRKANDEYVGQKSHLIRNFIGIDILIKSVLFAKKPEAHQKVELCITWRRLLANLKLGNYSSEHFQDLICM
jgi:hypothetical protein